MRRVYVRPVKQAPKPVVWEHREVCASTHGAFPSGWQVHHLDHNHHNNDPANVVALPPSIHKLLHARRLHPSRAACDAAVTWWRLAHPMTRRRLTPIKVVAIFKDYRKREAAVGREARVAAYVATQRQPP